MWVFKSDRDISLDSANPQAESLVRTATRMAPIILFAIGCILILNARFLGAALSTTQLSATVTSTNLEEVAEKSMNFKLIGGGIILYGAALIVRRHKS